MPFGNVQTLLTVQILITTIIIIIIIIIILIIIIIIMMIIIKQVFQDVMRKEEGKMKKFY